MKEICYIGECPYYFFLKVVFIVKVKMSKIVFQRSKASLTPYFEPEKKYLISGSILNSIYYAGQGRCEGQNLKNRTLAAKDFNLKVKFIVDVKM